MTTRALDIDFDELFQARVFGHVYGFRSRAFRADKGRHLLTGNIYFFCHSNDHYFAWQIIDRTFRSVIFIILSSLIKEIFKIYPNIVCVAKRSEPAAVLSLAPNYRMHHTVAMSKIISAHPINSCKSRFFGYFFLQNLEKQAFTC
jgi:hypothetical protein